MPRKTYRRGDPTLVFVIFAVLSTGGMIAAIVANRSNKTRLAAYLADPTCHRIADAVSTAPAGGSCSTTTEPVTAQWKRSYKSSYYYFLAVGRDSFALEGSRDKLAWQSAPVGTTVTAERFVDPETHQTRVTSVRIAGNVIQTGWNPEYRGLDTTVGVDFLALMAVGSTIGAVVYGRRRANR